MPFIEAVRLAFAQIRVQKLKSFFTLVGVMIGVMFLIAVVSIVEGMTKYIEDDFAGRLLGANTFTLRRFPAFGNQTTPEQWNRWLRSPRFYRADIEEIREVLSPGLLWATENRGNVASSSAFAPRPRSIQTLAVQGDYFALKKFGIAAGRAISRQEYELGAPVVVLGQDAAGHFFPGLDPVGRELRIARIPFTVIGVIERQGNLFGQSLDQMIVVPLLSPARRIITPRGDISAMLVQAPTQIVLEEAMEDVRELIRSKRQLRPAETDNFVLETSASALAFLGKIKATMTIAGTALPAIGLIVGGMVIMNIMLVAVAERTHEIGIRKSLGARRRDILRQFLVEATALSTLGAVLGIALGIGGAFVIAWKTPLPAAVAPWSIVAATLLGTVVGIVSGVYPARRASLLDPIDALRRE